jgi:hypothetical protein
MSLVQLLGDDKEKEKDIIFLKKKKISALSERPSARIKEKPLLLSLIFFKIISSL